MQFFDTLTKAKHTLKQRDNSTSAATEPLLTSDLVEADNSWRLIFFLCTDQQVANPLVRATFMVIGNELANNMIEMLFAENNEVIKCFVFLTLYPPFKELKQRNVPSLQTAHPDRE